MKEPAPENPITRRNFIELASAALASAGLAAKANAETAAHDPQSAAPAEALNTASPHGKIALEEHFTLAEIIEDSYAVKDLPPATRSKILDLGAGRLADMDRGGLDLCILSLTAPGIQSVPDTSKAIALARRANDHLAENIAKNPKRLKGFAALPMQDPQAAAQELARCVRELGFLGALVNGFSQVGVADSAVFYDLPQYRPSWATVQELDAPFYLHPRLPLETCLQAYEGHAWLAGSPWGFAVETSIHALRLMGSGLFDEYPKLKIILGHMGEAIPHGIWRVDNRIRRSGLSLKAQRPLGSYLRENFYITTSGNFRTQALTDVILEIGADRVLYSVDYPYEDVVEAQTWLDHCAINDADRIKIAHANAHKLFRL
jgi:predicted TIM-barrel fold metal-dependent hydrolase